MLFLQRAEWKLADGQKEAAIADADKMLEHGGDQYEWLIVHSHFLQTAGEFERAVDDWKRIDRESRRTGTPSRVHALNGLAYARALAGIEIEEGVENVNDALERAPGDAAILDTRGFLLYQRGDDAALALGLQDLTKAVQAVEPLIGGLTSTDTAEKKTDPFSLVQSYPKTWREAWPYGQRDSATQREMARRSVAVMHYHRALVFEALGREAGAEADRDAAQKLIGKEPDETLF
jgi:tetratricopeptide (TPR) repeat protein